MHVAASLPGFEDLIRGAFPSTACRWSAQGRLATSLKTEPFLRRNCTIAHSFFILLDNRNVFDNTFLIESHSFQISLKPPLRPLSPSTAWKLLNIPLARERLLEDASHRAADFEMRLINVRTYELRDFMGDLSTYPSYAILSHTWERDEVSYTEMQELSVAKRKRGFKKIEMCCRQAVADGYNWAWVDTCCIDKTSSAELSEAINSMYKWYEASMVCYAFLSDVINVGKFKQRINSASAAPKWFKRGWTLQELIAPLRVKFFSHGWRFLGTKQDLSSLLSKWTGIQGEVLQHQVALHNISVANRMHWASNRRTTRVEDIAYCLLGIFDVNMPLLYGEGMRAFERLQEQILQTTNDSTIFLWQLRDPDQGPSETWLQTARPNRLGSMFASSPREFDRICHAVSLANDDSSEPQLVLRVKGLRITLPMRPARESVFDAFPFPESWKETLNSSYLAALPCTFTRAPWTGSRVVIFLRPYDATTFSPNDLTFIKATTFVFAVPEAEVAEWKRYTCLIRGQVSKPAMPSDELRVRSHVELGPGAPFYVETIEIQRKYPEGHLFDLLCWYQLRHHTEGQQYVLACGLKSDDSKTPVAFLECRESPRSHHDFDLLLETIERQAREEAQWKPLRDAYGPIVEQRKQLENGLVMDIILKRERGIPHSPVDEFRVKLECYAPPRVALCADHSNTQFQRITYGAVKVSASSGEETIDFLRDFDQPRVFSRSAR